MLDSFIISVSLTEDVLMKKYEVTITETLVKKVIISAETVEDAVNIADDMNFNGEIDWSSDVVEDGDTVAREV